VEQGTTRSGLSQFNSNNTKLLTVEETMQKLLTIPYVRDQLASVGIEY